MACTEQEIGYDIFNLSESQVVRLDHLIDFLSKALGKEAITDRKPLQSGDVPITYADISKSRHRLGYDPEVKIKEGLKRFVEWLPD